MPIKIDKLWSTDRFQRLPSRAKLLYLYLLTSPQLNQLGVIRLRVTPFCTDLSFDRDDLRYATKNLIRVKFVDVKEYEGSVFFIVKGVFNPNIKSDNILIKLQDILSLYPKDFVIYLESIDIKLHKKVVVFKTPSAEEVTEYARSIGYDINGREFVDFYNNSSENRLDGRWEDGRGKVITDWKAKMRRVWCKEERKIKVIEGCPKGMENLSIRFMDKDYYPESWVEGLPKHSDFGVTKMLQKEFNKISGK